METETAGPTPALAHGQRITPEIATEVVTAAWADQEAVLLRIVPDWNAASSVKARMASTAAFAPHLEIIDFFRNFTVEVVGVGDTCSFAQMVRRVPRLSRPVRRAGAGAP